MQENIVDDLIKESQRDLVKIIRLEHENEVLRRLKQRQTDTLNFVTVCFILVVLVLIAAICYIIHLKTM